MPRRFTRKPAAKPPTPDSSPGMVSSSKSPTCSHPLKACPYTGASFVKVKHQRAHRLLEPLIYNVDWMRKKLTLPRISCTPHCTRSSDQKPSKRDLITKKATCGSTSLGKTRYRKLLAKKLKSCPILLFGTTLLSKPWKPVFVRHKPWGP